MTCKDRYVAKDLCNNQTCISNSRCDKCRICQNCDESWCGLEEHIVNFAVLQSTCDKCEEEELNVHSKCNVCGSRCEKCRVVKKNAKVLPCTDSCGFRQRVFKGKNVPSQFCSHIMTSYYKNTVLIAHNAKGFDNYPILNSLIDDHAVKPDKIIFDGSKINYMHVAKGLDLTFLDSLNFISMKLSDIPKCFDLEELTKGFFPHYFNKTENQNYRGPYPSEHEYGVNYMSSDEISKFREWYGSRKGEIFDFQTEMLKYCVSDVDILRRSCLKFRKLMMDVTSVKLPDANGEMVTKKRGIDPFDHITIASACQAIYRYLFLEETYETILVDKQNNQILNCCTKFETNGTFFKLPDEEWVCKETMDSDKYTFLKTVFRKSPLAMVPSLGYVSKNNFSKISIQWLEWKIELARRQGKPIEIQHALMEWGNTKFQEQIIGWMVLHNWVQKRKQLLMNFGGSGEGC